MPSPSGRFVTSPQRRTGVLVPLSAIPSASSWGIGEIPDLVPLARWLRLAGVRVLQLLPVNEVPPRESSPYSALTAMAIDPQYIGLARLDDFQALGGEGGLPADEREQLCAVRASARVDYAGVRRLKDGVLRRCWRRFGRDELSAGTERAARFHAYVARERWWLDDYAVFRALQARYPDRGWTDWPTPVRERDRAALDEAREALGDEIHYRHYLQWTADEQWAHARREIAPLAIFGDLPFMVSGDSADVWAHQDEFRLDASAGAPPDAFAADGQDWGLPVYRWDVLRDRDFDWLRERGRRYATLFDGFRVDHLVGFYRTFHRLHADDTRGFVPASEPEQLALGERVLQVFRDSGSEIIAEDLGTVPDFIRASLARLGVPGYRVLRWEREWHAEGAPFRDPADYPVASVATTGTHDTEPLVVWWEGADAAERAAVLAIPSLAARLPPGGHDEALATPGMPAWLREGVLDTLIASGAGLVLLPIGDVFGWADRINRPATVGPGNWTWRLPWAVERLEAEPVPLAVAARAREWSVQHSRWPDRPFEQ